MNTLPKKKKNRYRSQDGKSIIEVRIRSVSQLFDARDPAPFRDRDLDDDFVEYITSSAEELNHADAFKILIHIEEVANSQMESNTISDSIKDFFEYQVDLKSKQLTKVLKTGQLFLLFGIIFLFICLVVSDFFGTVHFLEETYREFLKQGFIIMGWVAMWKPLELILFDWWPIYDKMKIYRKILASEIEVRSQT